MKKSIFFPLFVGAALLVVVGSFDLQAQRVSQSTATLPPPAAPQKPKDPVKEMSDVLGNSKDMVDVTKGIVDNGVKVGIADTGDKSSGLLGPLSKGMKYVKNILGIYSAGQKEGPRGIIKEGVKQVAGDAAGNFVGTTVGTAVTTTLFPVLGPLAPIAGAGAGFVAKKFTQSAVKGTVDEVDKALKTGKMPDTTKTIGDAQYKNSGGDRGWKEGDKFVGADGKTYKVGGEFMGEDGTKKWPPGYAFDPKTGRHFRLPDKTKDNSVDAPKAPPPPPPTKTPFDDYHELGGKTENGTPLGPDSYKDPVTGKIIILDKHTKTWKEYTEDDYRRALGLKPLPPLSNNDWATGLGGMMPGSCSGPGGCSPTQTASTSTQQSQEKKDADLLRQKGAAPTTSPSAPAHVEKAPPPVSNGTISLYEDTTPEPPPAHPPETAPEPAPAPVPHTETAHAEPPPPPEPVAPAPVPEQKPVPAPTQDTAPVVQKETPATAPVKTTKAAPAPVAKGDEGKTAFSIDTDKPKPPVKSDATREAARSAGQAAAQTAARSAAQAAVRGAAQAVARSAATSVRPPVVRPPAVKPPPPPPPPSRPPACSGPCR